LRRIRRSVRRRQLNWILYIQRRGKLFKKNNERRYVREIRSIKLSARLPQIRLMAKIRARPIAKIKIKIKVRIIARIMINWLLKSLKRLSIRYFGILIMKKIIG
jgi:hypothetical protein